MGSKNEYPPLAGPYGAMLGTRYDPVYTDFTPEGTKLAPEVRPGRAFPDPYPRHQADRHPGTAPAATGASRGSPTGGSPSGGRLLAQFDRRAGGWSTRRSWSTFGHLQEAAFALLATGKLHDALDYAREPLARA